MRTANPPQPHYTVRLLTPVDDEATRLRLAEEMARRFKMKPERAAKLLQKPAGSPIVHTHDLAAVLKTVARLREMGLEVAPGREDDLDEAA